MWEPLRRAQHADEAGGDEGGEEEQGGLPPDHRSGPAAIPAAAADARHQHDLVRGRVELLEALGRAARGDAERGGPARALTR